MIDLPQADIDRILDDFERFCRERHDRHMATEIARARRMPHSHPETIPWWIVICNTSHERRATLGLRDAGFEVWAPETWIEARYGRGSDARRICKRQAAAPGYLFTRHVDPRAWPAMVGIDGIMQVRLWEDGTPMVVPAFEITRWKGDLLPRGIGIVEDAYRIGDRVSVTAGPFAGFRGAVERYLQGRGVWVSVNILGRFARVEMAEVQITKAA